MHFKFSPFGGDTKRGQPAGGVPTAYKQYSNAKI